VTELNSGNTAFVLSHAFTDRTLGRSLNNINYIIIIQTFVIIAEKFNTDKLFPIDPVVFFFLGIEWQRILFSSGQRS